LPERRQRRCAAADAHAKKMRDKDLPPCLPPAVAAARFAASRFRLLTRRAQMPRCSSPSIADARSSPRFDTPCDTRLHRRHRCSSATRERRHPCRLPLRLRHARIMRRRHSKEMPSACCRVRRRRCRHAQRYAGKNASTICYHGRRMLRATRALAACEAPPKPRESCAAGARDMKWKDAPPAARRALCAWLCRAPQRHFAGARRLILCPDVSENAAAASRYA